jgi:hypothetical protein
MNNGTRMTRIERIKTDFEPQITQIVDRFSNS